MEREEIYRSVPAIETERLLLRKLMKEAAEGLLAFGFKEMGLNKVEAPIMLENAQSRRLAEKLGMKFEGVARDHMVIKDEFVDLAIYSLLKREYLAELVEAL